MANTITIKKNAYNSTSAPTSLAFGELAVNNNNGAGAKLYVGSRTSGNSADVTDIQSTILAAVPVATAAATDSGTKGKAQFSSDNFAVTGNGFVTIKDSGIVAAELASNSVTTAKINSSAVTTAKIAADAVTNAKMADNSVDTAQVVDDSITAAKLAHNLTLPGNISTGGTLTVGGDLTVNGTTTTVNSTTTTLDDPIMTLGGDTAPSSDDNKDRGVEFRYYSGTAKLGFMGWDDSEEKFTLMTDATNTSEVFSGTLAPLKMGALTATSVDGATIDGGTY
jgi:hypothetical protein